MAGPDRTQELTSRVFVLNRTLEKSLAALAELYGKEARRKLEALRDETINEFKNFNMSANREMDHAKIVRPAIQAIELVFEDVLRDLSNDDTDNSA